MSVSNRSSSLHAFLGFLWMACMLPRLALAAQAGFFLFQIRSRNQEFPI
jgi:hypothetical protein